uniref:Cyclin N-terminal domain-containing protein n=1 Tax=Noctiluca scintillans TaxID=2966 RepID=A0A7S1A2S9_NOCSC
MEDNLEWHSVSDDHIAALFAEERQLQFPSSLMSLSMLVRRSEVLAVVQETLAYLRLPADDVFLAAQVLDSVGLWFESDMRVQVVSAMAALYMCIKLRSDPLEPDHCDLLCQLAERANQFFEHSTDWRKVVREEVIQQEMDLLDSLHYFLPTSHIGTWIEFFRLRTDVLTRESQTPLLRFAADLAKDLSRSLVCQINISKDNSPSAIAFNAWCLACVLSCAMTSVWDTFIHWTRVLQWTSRGAVQIGGSRRSQFTSRV